MHLVAAFVEEIVCMGLTDIRLCPPSICSVSGLVFGYKVQSLRGTVLLKRLCLSCQRSIHTVACVHFLDSNTVSSIYMYM